MLESASDSFPSLPIPKALPLVEQARHLNHFRLPFSLLCEVEDKPPSYKIIRKNVWLVPSPDGKSDKDAGKFRNTG
jgi:hypothetical protein